MKPFYIDVYASSRLTLGNRAKLHIYSQNNLKILQENWASLKQGDNGAIHAETEIWPRCKLEAR